MLQVLILGRTKRFEPEDLTSLKFAILQALAFFVHHFAIHLS